MPPYRAGGRAPTIIASEDPTFGSGSCDTLKHGVNKHPTVNSAQLLDNAKPHVYNGTAWHFDLAARLASLN